VLVDFDDQPIKLGDKDMTVAMVFMHAAMAPPPPPEPGKKERTVEETLDRFMVGVAMRKTMLDQQFEIDQPMLDTLEKDVNRMFQTIVSGQIIAMIKGVH